MIFNRDMTRDTRTRPRFGGIQAVEAANEGEEAFTLGSVGHIFQFLQHNQIYAQQVFG